jgi:hypothetical protein
MASKQSHDCIGTFADWNQIQDGPWCAHTQAIALSMPVSLGIAMRICMMCLYKAGCISMQKNDNSFKNP